MPRQKASTTRTPSSMTPANRTAQFAQLYQILAKHYRASLPNPDRPVLEHLLFAAVLENARHAVAEQVFQVLKTEFFDWNEIRVSTLRDLSEVLSALPDPHAAAIRIKQPLQAVFEAAYQFDLEELRKFTQGQAIERLQKITGVSRFMLSYVVQTALGGHTIPLDQATLRFLNILGLADESEMASGNVGGLERAIPKSQGPEFAWLLHECAADFWVDHRGPQVVKVFKAMDPQSLTRLEAWEGQPVGTSALARTGGGPAIGTAAAAEAPSPAGESAPPRRRRKSAGTSREVIMPTETSQSTPLAGAAQSAASPSAETSVLAGSSASATGPGPKRVATSVSSASPKTVPQPPAEPPKRRGRPPGSGKQAQAQTQTQAQKPDTPVDELPTRRGRKKRA